MIRFLPGPLPSAAALAWLFCALAPPATAQTPLAREGARALELRVGGGVGLIDTAPATALGGSLIHRPTGITLRVRGVQAGLRKTRELAGLVGLTYDYAPFTLSGGAGMGRLTAHYGRGEWTIGETVPVIPSYQGTGVSLEAHLGLQGRRVGGGWTYARAIDEDLGFTAHLLGLTLRL
jgi:hypothetical protein